MISETVNLTTGPVAISANIRSALAEMPVSHRSPEFRKLYKQTTSFLCDELQVKNTSLLTGSGTLANEVMIQQVKATGGKGLILSNGEFGNRLIEQCKRNELEFQTYIVEWGQQFDLSIVESLVGKYKIRWILFCHCETSTGIINDINGLTTIAKENFCRCYVDCMSTIGTAALNLSQVTMATGSSGKGLASIPGIALVFSNVESQPVNDSPVYLDLGYYFSKQGIPFTLSSNLLKALYVSICEKLNPVQYELIKVYRKKIFTILNEQGVVPYNNSHSVVFTLVSPPKELIEHVERSNILFSHQSNYLEERGWYQLGTFGYYTEKQLQYVVASLQSAFEFAM